MGEFTEDELRKALERVWCSGAKRPEFAIRAFRMDNPTDEQREAERQHMAETLRARADKLRQDLLTQFKK